MLVSSINFNFAIYTHHGARTRARAWCRSWSWAGSRRRRGCRSWAFAARGRGDRGGDLLSGGKRSGSATSDGLSGRSRLQNAAAEEQGLGSVALKCIQSAVTN
jgi:hypothetical protein